MNATIFLIAGALALAAPVGYFTLDTMERPAPTAPSAATTATTAPAEPGENLIVRIHHDGEEIEALLEVGGASTHMVISEGDTILPFQVDEASPTDVRLAFERRPDLLGLTLQSAEGSDTVTYDECDVVEVLFQTFARGQDAGIAVWGAQCVPGPVRHVAVESTGPRVVFPWPTCPTSCSMGYGFGRAGDLVFEVPEGTSAIEVSARWDAESPMTERLAIWLTTPSEECGEGCWMAVAQGEGEEQASFRYDAPAPGEYALSSFFTMPVGASVQQDVWLEAVVVPS